MSLTKEAMKRCVMETKILEFFSPLVSENIFVIPTSNINQVKCLIIGPENTPYENGFYLFEIIFPNNYPFSPPKATFYTNDGKTRMHPNYYTSGKVCVSLIGTWSGPGWTSCNTLSSVLMTFRSLFIENPLWQEPGFMGDTTKKNRDYNSIITHENYRIGIVQMINNTPNGFECFREIMYEHLIKHRERILSRLNELHSQNPNIEMCSPYIYKFSTKIDYKKIISELETIYNNKISYNPIYNNTLAKLIEIIPNKTHISPKLLYNNFIKSDIDTDMEFGKLINILEIRNIISRNNKGHIIKV